MMNNLKKAYDAMFKALKKDITNKLYIENKDYIVKVARNILNDYDLQNKGFVDYDGISKFGIIPCLGPCSINRFNPKFIKNNNTVYNIEITSQLAKEINQCLIYKYTKLLKYNNISAYKSGNNILIFVSKGDLHKYILSKKFNLFRVVLECI